MTKIEELRLQIERDIAYLRTVIEEPVDIRYGEFVSFEVRPDNDDDRLNVYRKDWGVTIVNYTHEGLILDVCCEEGLDSIHTACFMAEDLENDDD